MDVYEDTPPQNRIAMSECSKTEDVYQTLHQPPVVRNPNPTHEPVRPCRLKMMLLILNTLLLVAILTMNGLFIATNLQSAKSNQPQASGVSEKREREELWRLHNDVFYLFWEAEGNCTDAKKFCRNRKSRIATVTNTNEDWIMSRANGRKLWINIAGVTAGLLNETLHHCPLHDQNSDTSGEKMPGLVCARSQRDYYPFRYRHCDFYHHRYFGHDIPFYEDDIPENPTEVPESAASTAASVHSVK
ncbi:hypothetical protein NFI96_024507, partial [Prochilodus magdalenae]